MYRSLKEYILQIRSVDHSAKFKIKLFSTTPPIGKGSTCHRALNTKDENSITTILTQRAKKAVWPKAVSTTKNK